MVNFSSKQILLALVQVVVFGAQFADGVQINIDYSKAPDLAKFSSRVKATLEDWFPYISEKLLPSPGYKPPTSIPIYFDPNYDGAAYALGGKIVGSVKYYRSHQDDIGSMIHEMVHVIQSYKNAPSWLTEGIADWVRYYYFEPSRKQNKPGPNNRYTDGYGVTAYFLNYITKNVRKDMVYWANKDAREGTYADTIWPRLTGKTLDTLWADMMRSG